MLPELLAPAGSMEALRAAIMGGCDAVYLGGHSFGARHFASNFSDEELIEAISYAHLYGVKVYVTVNTIIYEKEVTSFLAFVDFLYEQAVDALIIQDLGMVDLIHQRYPDFELHASTQMHIHNLDGLLVAQELGIKRAVLARELSIDEICCLKKKSPIELEVFVQGALCMSYSGQCFMSALIGSRSGNRGSCAQCCRQYYELLDDKKKTKASGYLLSTKDLCSFDTLEDLLKLKVASLKIEGRMKRAEYVYFATFLYRRAMDSFSETGKVQITTQDIKQLSLLFSRGFTRGFLGREKEIVNAYRPNHMGIHLGKVVNKTKRGILVSLEEPLSIGDGIRILGKEDIGFTVTSMFCKEKIEYAFPGMEVEILCSKKIELRSEVRKTTDHGFMEQLTRFQKRRVGIKGIVSILKDEPISLCLDDGICQVMVTGGIALCAKKIALTEEAVRMQIDRLQDSVYVFDQLDVFLDPNLFLNKSELNALRREAILQFNQKRLERKRKRPCDYQREVPNFPNCRQISICLSDAMLFHKIKDKKYDILYLPWDTKQDGSYILRYPRVVTTYQKKGLCLVGELGGLRQSDVWTDFSFHVTNSYTLALLHSMGAKQVCLSYELTREQIKDIMDAYFKRYHKHPNVEICFYGREEAMLLKYPLLKENGLSDKGYLKDRFGNLYPVKEKEQTILYHYKIRNLEDLESYYQLGIHVLRFTFLEEEELSILK